MVSWYVEQRRHPRVTINATGKLIAISQRLRLKKSIACTVVDISAGGALIDAASTIDDEQFYLEIDGDPGKLRSCLVVRRLGANRVGVKFV